MLKRILSSDKRRRRSRFGCAVPVLVFLAVMLWPERLVIPVRGATTDDWNHQTFWYYPWGRSVVHKGIDVFAAEGTDVVAATAGLVTFAGELSLGGTVVVILGPRYRFHYYAHLRETTTRAGRVVGRGQPIATVGTTGNAAGKPPHLHYSIVTPIPYPWRIDSAPQGWLKMFFLDPSAVWRLSPRSAFWDASVRPEAPS